jgi:hypothetical protein
MSIRVPDTRWKECSVCPQVMTSPQSRFKVTHSRQL